MQRCLKVPARHVTQSVTHGVTQSVTQSAFLRRFTTALNFANHAFIRMSKPAINFLRLGKIANPQNGVSVTLLS